MISRNSSSASPMSETRGYVKLRATKSADLQTALRHAKMTRDARPFIGVTADLSEAPGKLDNYQESTLFVPQRYLSAIEQAGAIALVLPPNQSGGGAAPMIGLVDGLVITGGNFDIHPRLLWRTTDSGTRRDQSAPDEVRAGNDRCGLRTRRAHLGHLRRRASDRRRLGRLVVSRH